MAFLSASNSQLALSLRSPAAVTDSSMYKLSLPLIFVALFWSTTIVLSFLELAEENCFGHANVFHPCDVASPVQLHLKQNGLYAGQACSFTGGLAF